MRRSIVITAALAALAPAGLACGDAVDFQIVAQDVTVDRASQTADFTVTFSRAPVFVTVDDSEADAFQYEIDADSTDLQTEIDWTEIDSVIRGAEIAQGQGIPVREPPGEEVDPDSGGWGPVRALLPFELQDNMLTFSAPLEALGAENGTFRYRAFAIDQGGMTTQIVGAVIPTPAALGPGLALLGGVLALRAMRRRLI